MSSLESVTSAHRYWRRRIFSSIYIGYICFYLTRKSFTFAMPALMTDLGWSAADLGFLGSVLYITYGVSKFLSGFLADLVNPRWFMSTGLILTGFFNVFFGLSSSLTAFAVFWGLNGFFQGWGWAPCAKQLTYWFAKSERGFWWSLQSTAHNIGGAMIPLIVAAFTGYAGWRWSMHVPGIVAIGVGLCLMATLRGTPESLGLTPIEEVPLQEGTSALPSQKENILSLVLRSKPVWLLALTYFFVYVVRIGVNDWGSVYLVKERSFTLMHAAQVMTWLELGGFAGQITAGLISDRFFDGRRLPVMVWFSLGILLAVTLFWSLQSGASLWIYSVNMSLLGFFIYGPQMMVGLAAAEFVDKKAACSANGFAGFFAYAGAAVTGFPLGKVIDELGWGAFFAVLAGCCFLILALISAIPKSEPDLQTQPTFAFSST